MHYNCVWHIKPIYPTKFQEKTVTNIEAILENICLVMQELWSLVLVVTLNALGSKLDLDVK